MCFPENRVLGVRRRLVTGESALDAASAAGHAEIVRHLLEHSSSDGVDIFELLPRLVLASRGLCTWLDGRPWQAAAHGPWSRCEAAG